MSPTMTASEALLDEKDRKAQIERALSKANVNALRVALFHQTGDPDLPAMPVRKEPIRGGALTSYTLDKKDRATIRKKALAYLLSHSPTRPKPTKAEAVQLMEMFTGEPLSQNEIDYGYEDLAFDPLARSPQWTGERPAVADDFEAIIVGAGVSGIMAAIHFERVGIKYRILERMDDIGGTWHLNDYPEARVDISTYLYQYKFEENYPWKSYFATRDELQDYFNFIVDKYGLRSKIHLNTSVETASWNEAKKVWELSVQSPDGQSEKMTSNFLISASGLFSTPNLPDIKDIELFKGAMFHTTAWDHDFDYKGKRVALIGTGSTGSQLAPAIAEQAAEFTIYQRTPNWVTPIQDYQAEVSADTKWLLAHMPGYWNWFIYSSYVAEKQIMPLQVLDEDWIAKGGHVNAQNAGLAEALKKFIKSKIGDDEVLFKKLVPDHPPLARRLVIDNGWYDTIVRDNVELVTDSIEAFTESGIVTADGAEREFDLVILSAGFKVSQYLWPVAYEGANGQRLKDLWSKDGARAYLSMALPGFPNFFMYYGPNGQARAGGFHSWAEVYGRYMTNLILHTIETGKRAIEIKREAYQDYNDRMDEAMKSLLWESEGGGGYYVNPQGRSGVNMPWTMDEFYEFVKSPDPENYELR